MHLCKRSGGETCEGNFVAYWLHRILFFLAPLWVFTLFCRLFGTAALLMSWVEFRSCPFSVGKALK